MPAGTKLLARPRGRPDGCPRNIRTAPCRDRESPASAHRPRRCSRTSGGADRTGNSEAVTAIVPGARSRRKLEPQPQRLALGEDFRRRPFRLRAARPSADDFEAGAAISWMMASRDRRRPPDRAAAPGGSMLRSCATSKTWATSVPSMPSACSAQIEVAEGNGMGRCRRVQETATQR